MNHTKKSKGTHMKPSNRTLSMMSPKVRQSIMAVSVVTALGLSNVAWADNMTERFASHARYAEYKQALDGNDKERAYAIKKQITEEICDSIMVQVVDESNALAKKGIKARYDKWDIQTKVNFINIYLKSKKILVNEDKRATFNPNLSDFMERIYFHTGTTFAKAQEIKEKFVFNDGNKFIDELAEIAKMADKSVIIETRNIEIRNDEFYTKEANELFEKIKPSASSQRTDTEIEKIKVALKSYIKSYYKFDGKALENISVVEAVAPEVKNNKEYSDNIQYAKRHDKASQIDKNIPETIQYCNSEIEKLKSDIKKLQAKSDNSGAIKFYNDAIKEFQNVLENLKNGENLEAKRKYFFAEIEKEGGKWTEILKRLEELAK